MHDVRLDTFKSNNFDVPQRDGAGEEETRDYLDRMIERILAHRGVDHPFLTAYAERGLPPERERLLYLETYYYFLHVPFYIASLCTLTRDENIMRAVVDNVRDELGEEQSHSQLFVEFLRGVGVSQGALRNHRCLPSTKALNDGIHRMYTTPPLIRAMGGLYAEESQSAAMVARYDAGLERSGHSRESRHFWLLHIEAEVGHSNSVFNCIHPYLVSGEQRRLFEEGVDAYMALLERYWDGIEALVGLP